MGRLRLLPPAALLLVLLSAVLVRAQQDKGEVIAPYFPTPETIVDKMLKLGQLKAGETMFDLGSGDGRIVIDAARKYKAQAIGVELDDSLFKQSMDRIKTLGLTKTARIIHGDLLKQDYSTADLLTVYLPASKTVPTPKAVLGDIAGAPGILPYSQEVYRYMRIDRKSVV